MLFPASQNRNQTRCAASCRRAASAICVKFSDPPPGYAQWAAKGSACVGCGGWVPDIGRVQPAHGQARYGLASVHSAIRLCWRLEHLAPILGECGADIGVKLLKHVLGSGDD